jgi:photosystem II stability/assembly factor-like uncharacterized protein
MPLLSPEAKRAGVFPGGEGGQWPRAEIAVSPADPDFLLLPIDVGGLYRSFDGGGHWEIAMVGWNARGANGFAIDPRDASRVIGIGGNSLDWNPQWGTSPHGLYLSTDKASRWKQVLAVPDGLGGSVTFDPASYDAQKGHCTVAYYSAPRSGLYRTEDGGATWALVSRQPVGMGNDEHNAPLVRVHPTRGYVYLGGKTGLFRSDDGGRTFRRLREGAVWGLAVTPASPDRVYVSGAEGLLASTDSGAAWVPLAARGIDREKDSKPVRNVSASPVDPYRLTCWVSGENWKWVRYVSHDGGATWQPVQFDNTLAPLPFNVRNGFFAWHPKDANIVWGLGGDWATRSTDGGRTFAWSNNGFNGVMVGGLFSFSAHAPDRVFLAFQDYNAALTTDGGKTWDYRDASGKGWGGYCYGGHTADGRVLYYGDAEGWGGPRRLRVSRDGGKTWAFVNGADGKPLLFKGPDVSLSDPADPNVLFASDLRSADGGKTWGRMEGCDGVYTHAPGTKVLYGKKGSAVVRSADHGATWQKVAEAEGGFDDLAVDHRTGRVYIASQERLKVWEPKAAGGAWTTLETPRNQYGDGRVSTVAVDPQAPDVVYVGGPNNIYNSHATICRSPDGGRTWRNLTVTAPLKGGVKDGPHEVSAIRVHPRTREAWVAGQCFGMWRIAPPAKGEKGLPAAQASAPRAVLPPTPADLTVQAHGL